MDYPVDFLDHHLLTPYVYPEWLTPDDWRRQLLTLLAIVNVGGALVYLIPATLNYYFIFDHKLLAHPKILRDKKTGKVNQIAREIQCSLSAVPGMALPTALLFLAELQGYAKLYDSVEGNGGYLFLVASFFSFMLFTDFCIYWIHRYLHHPLLYKPLHKIHHLWKIPTPFASHAFHPLDGFLQSLPYHIYPFLFPLHKGLYLGLFVFVNVWSTSIHDGDYRVPDLLKPIINGCAHHSDHHLFFNYNYGEYLTLWDRVFGSFKDPSAYHRQGIHDDIARMSRGEKVEDDDYEGLGEDPLKKGTTKAVNGSGSSATAATVHNSLSAAIDTNGYTKAVRVSPRTKARKMD